MRKQLLTAFLQFFIVAASIAQPVIPTVVVNAGNDTTIPCGNVTLNATFSNVPKQTTAYTVAQIPYTPYSYTNGTTVNIFTDDIYSGAVALPFQFCFYGNTYSQCWIGTNGFITFNPQTAGGYCPWPINNPIPNPGNPLNAIMGPWQDINPAVGVGSDIRYATYGTAPFRVFVVSFSNIPMYQCTNLLHTSQIILHETTNLITINILNKPLCGWNSGRAIEGIHNANGTQAVVVPGRNSPTQWTAQNDAWRFTPNGPNAYTFAWFNNGVNIGSSNPITVTPNGNQSYVAQLTATCNNANIRDTVNVILSGFNFNPPVVSDVSCFGGSDGSITASVAGGIGPFNYVWSTLPPQLGQTASGLDTGSYTVTVSDAGGCTGTNTYSIAQPATPPDVSPIVTDALCNGGASGQIDGNGSGGTGAYTYAWSNGLPSQQVVTGVSAGTYFVTGTDANGCTATDSAIVNEPTAITFNPPQITDASCFGGSTGTVTANPTGGTGAYSYAWSNGGNAQTISGIPAGSYTVTVTDANSCTGTDIYLVSEPTEVVIGVPSIQDVNCFGGIDGAITATASGGTGTISYTWNTTPVEITPLIDSLVAGSYTLIVNDQNLCSDTATFTVNQPASAISINAPTITNASCNGGNDGQIVADATGGTAPLNYLWTRVSNGQSLSGQTISNLFADTYNLTVIDANGCQNTASYNITEPTAVNATPIVTNVVCNGGNTGQIDANGNGGTGALSYTWSNGLPSQQVVTGLTAGLYTVTVSDASNCTFSTSVTVTEASAIAFNAPMIVDVLCFGNATGSITADPIGGAGGYSYVWSNSGSGQTISSLVAGNYTVTVTDASSCTSSVTYTVNQPPSALAIANQSQTDVLCYGFATGTASVVVTGGTVTSAYTYFWTNNVSTSASAVNLQAGPYTVTVTDANGCSITASFNLIQPVAPLGAVISATVDPLCNNGTTGTMTVTANGGTISYNYLWDSNAGNQTTAIAISLAAGTYVVTVTDANNCTTTASGALAEPAPLTASPVVNNVDCFGNSTGSIDINPAGGAVPYSFIWSDLQTTQVASNLPANIYTCTVTDANGCSNVFTETIIQPTIVTANSTVTPESCPGSMDGSITAIGAGGVSPYSFVLTGNGVNQTQPNGYFNGLAPGTYSIVITDDYGCIVSIPETVGGALEDAFTLSTDTVSCYGLSDGAAHVVALTLLNAPFEYSIDGGLPQYNGDFYDLPAGPHTVTVTNYNGCVSTVPVVIAEPLPVVADVVPDTLVLELGNSGSVLVNALNVIGSASYQWSDANGLSCMDCPNPVVTIYQTTDYTVTVSYTSANGIKCEGSATLHVEVLPATDSYVPNVFSPNGDGLNDVFNVFGQDVKTVDMRIFDRWGEMLYNSNNQWEGWDGTYQGLMRQPGVYTYWVDVTYLNDTHKELKGTVTLIR